SPRARCPRSSGRCATPATTPRRSASCTCTRKVVFYEPSVRVPLIVRPAAGGAPAAEGAVLAGIGSRQPKVLRVPEPGRVERGLVEHIDVGPTLRALAEAGPVPGSDGQSLRGHFEGGGHGATRDLAVSENHGFAAFITDRYKLIVWEDTREPV